MSNYTHLGFAGLGFGGLGVDEFAAEKRGFAAQEAARLAARKKAGAIAVTGVAKAPTALTLAPALQATPPAPVQTFVPAPALTVAVANAGDPTAPAAPSEPVPVMVFEEPPPAPSTDWMPYAVGAGVLVAAGVAIFFATRKG